MIWYTFLNGEVVETKTFNQRFETKVECEEMAVRVSQDLAAVVVAPHSYVLVCSTSGGKV